MRQPGVIGITPSLVGQQSLWQHFRLGSDFQSKGAKEGVARSAPVARRNRDFYAETDPLAAETLDNLADHPAPILLHLVMTPSP